ncbi:MAG: hypothetical protein NZ902_06645, partial [Acidilobaceae archaeon]|nr:hypothetical protein [Acidilobaceae archaeon]
MEKLEEIAGSLIEVTRKIRELEKVRDGLREEVRSAMLLAGKSEIELPGGVVSFRKTSPIFKAADVSWFIANAPHLLDVPPSSLRSLADADPELFLSLVENGVVEVDR